MQYNISIPQREILENNLNIDIVDAAIFDFIKDFSHSKFCHRMTDSSGSWFWISYDKVINEMPILGIKTKDAVYRRFKKLADVNLIEFNENNQSGGRTYFRFGKSYDLLITSSKLGFKTEGTDEKSEGYGFLSVGGTDEKSDEQIHHIEQDTIQLKGKSKKNVDNSKQEPIPMGFQLKEIWLGVCPSYPFDHDADMPELVRIGIFIHTQLVKAKKLVEPHFGTAVTTDEVLAVWSQLVQKIMLDKFWKLKSLKSIASHIPEFWNKANTNGQQANDAATINNRLDELIGKQ